jgi:tRNA (mo5U34)-methyltransferase
MTSSIKVNLHYLGDFGQSVDVEKLFTRLLQANRNLFDETNIPFLKCILEQPDIQARHFDFSGDSVIIGDKNELTQEQFQIVENQLKKFMPWRKGPFDIFGIEIDAEWKSNLKWDRFAPYLGSLKDQVICDIGCNNGYFMFKAAEHQPRLVLGIDPTRKFKLAFHYLNNFAGQKNLHMELLGFEDLILFKEVFDTIFCMGILYHHKSPMEVLGNCFGSMKKGGTLLLETMGISAKNEVCLFPERRYANMPNVWFIPSEKAVLNMLHRAGFREIECVYNHRLGSDEQRSAPWAEVSSLKDFLNPENQELTIEGYESPSRIYFVARK